jgi:hypothetical protein
MGWTGVELHPEPIDVTLAEVRTFARSLRPGSTDALLAGAAR